MSDIDVLVTGATGFLGRHVTNLLLRKGRRVASLSRHANATAGLVIRSGDLTDDVFVSDVLQELQPRLILHLAGSLGSNDVRALVNDNILATIQLVAAAAALEAPPRIVLASSSAVYRSSTRPIDESAELSPVTLYGVTKLAQEQAASLLSAPSAGGLVVARLFNLVGPGQSADFVLGKVARQIAEAEVGGPRRVVVRNTSTSRDFVDVRDAALALVLLGEAPGVAGPFNVATGVSHEIRTAIELLRGRAACDVTVEMVDPALAETDVSTQTGDPGRLQRATGWAPSLSFEDSLQTLLDSWRSRTRKGILT